MLKILVVSPDWPFPEYKNGVAKIVANLLARNNDFEADLMYFGSSHEDANFDFNILGLPIVSQQSTIKKLYKFAFSKLPLCTWAISESIDLLAEKLRRNHHNYDVIHLLGPSFALLSRYSKEVFFGKIVFSPIDSIGLHFRRRAKITRFGVNKIIYSIEAAKCKNFEMHHYPKFRKVSFVSDVDASWASRVSSDSVYFSIPNGVDVSYFSPRRLRWEQQERPSIIFTGNMDYSPNSDAANFLIDHVLPIVHQNIDLDVYIVGANPSRQLRSKSNGRIHITGFVDDIRPYLEKASFYVSPLREGSGIKNKVLEAMAMCKVVIGSRLSFDGIACKDGIHCINAPITAIDFAQAIISAVGNEKEYDAIALNARELILNRYSWDAVRREYLAFYS